MEATNNKTMQCPYCESWIRTAKGGFKCHVRTCGHNDITSTNKCPSTNPLLSRPIVGQTENIEYDCDYVGDDEYHNEGINNVITELSTNDGHKFDNTSTMYNKSPRKSLSLVISDQVSSWSLRYSKQTQG